MTPPRPVLIGHRVGDDALDRVLGEPLVDQRRARPRWRTRGPTRRVQAVAELDGTRGGGSLRGGPEQEPAEERAADPLDRRPVAEAGAALVEVEWSAGAARRGPARRVASQARGSASRRVGVQPDQRSSSAAGVKQRRTRRSVSRKGATPRVCRGPSLRARWGRLLDDFAVDTDRSGWAHIAYSHDSPDLGGSDSYTGYAVQQSGNPVGAPG